MAPLKFRGVGLQGGGGSEANFLEVCFGRIPYNNFDLGSKATSNKKSRLEISLTICRGHLGLSARSPKKVSKGEVRKKSGKGFPGPLHLQGPKSQKKIIED